jgi:hypothetical protein
MKKTITQIFKESTMNVNEAKLYKTGTTKVTGTSSFALFKETKGYAFVFYMMGYPTTKFTIKLLQDGIKVVKDEFKKSGLPELATFVEPEVLISKTGGDITCEIIFSTDVILEENGYHLSTGSNGRFGYKSNKK